MDLRSLHKFSRLFVLAALAAFCLLLPITIAGANIGWGVILGSLVAFAATGGKIGKAELAGAKSLPAKLLWAYFGIAVLTAALGVDPAHSFKFINQDFHKVWLFTLFSVALAIRPAPLVIPARWTPAESMSRGPSGNRVGAVEPSELMVLCCMALGFAVAAAIGIRQEIWFYRRGLASWMRGHAFVHPVVFGEQMASACLGAFCFLIRPQESLPSRPQKWAAGLLLVLLAAALFLNNTRAAIAGCAVGVIAICLVLPRMRRWAPLALILGLGVSLAGVYVSTRVLRRDWLGLQPTATAGTRPAPQGQRMRFILWKAAWRMGRDHFWTGVGLNNYREMFPRYFTGTFADGSNSWGTAHNLYLHQFAERGILGIGILLALFGMLWLRALRRAREKPDAFNLWAFGAWTAFLVMNLTEAAFQTEIVWMLLLFIWVWAETRFAGSDA